MAFDLGRFKQINDKHKLTVYGYIKDCQSVFPLDIPYYQIHDLIKQTCTLFYAPTHEWDLEFISPNVEFIEETNSMKQIEHAESSTFLRDTFDIRK